MPLVGVPWTGGPASIDQPAHPARTARGRAAAPAALNQSERFRGLGCHRTWRHSGKTALGEENAAHPRKSQSASGAWLYAPGHFSILLPHLPDALRTPVQEPSRPYVSIKKVVA